MAMRWLFFAWLALLGVGCGSGPPVAGSRDTGPRRDANDAASTDDGGTDVDASAPMDGGTDDTGTMPVDASGDDASDDAFGGPDAADAAVADANDASFDANNISHDDTGVSAMGDLGVTTCLPAAHVTGNPLGTAYDWMGCVLFETTAVGASLWAHNMGVSDHGVAFLHATSIASGTTGQVVTGTVLLTPTSVPLPYAVACAGTGSTLDTDATGAPTAFSFQGGTTLHTAGSNVTGGLVVSLGTTTTLNGDVGAHHFASTTADVVQSTASSAVTSMVIILGTTAVSLVFEQTGGAISGGIVQVASGATTDVYVVTGGTATASAITLPAMVSFLGTCGGLPGAQTLTGTLTR